MRKAIVLAALAICTNAWSNNIQLDNVTYVSSTNRLNVDVSWDNAWRNNDYHDAVWLYVKASPTGNVWQAQTLLGAFTSAPLEVADFTTVGIMLRPSANSAGDIPSTTVSIQLANFTGPVPDFKVFGVEMVHVEEGDYMLGDGLTSGVSRFERGDMDNVPFTVTSENSINIGTSAGQLQCPMPYSCAGTIPANYPKGWADFYLMKYEITQEQYVDFLNCLTRTQQDARTQTDLSGTTTTETYVMSGTASVSYYNSVRCDPDLGGTSLPVEFYCDLNENGVPNENDDGHTKAMNFLSEGDVIAYLDWSGLRPMTDMEYEKACRGPLPAIVQEFAWGTAQTANPTGIFATGTPDEYSDNEYHGPWPSPFTILVRVGIFATDTSSRATSGAGYYGAMELSSNVRELVVASVPGNYITYQGLVGDGTLEANGSGNEPNWNLLFKSTSSGQISSQGAPSVVVRSNISGGRGAF